MNKEKQVQLYIFLGLAFVVLLSFFVASNLGLIYLIIFFLIIFCCALFVLVELYLRAQHNIDNARIAINELNKVKIELNNIKTDLENRITIGFGKTEADLAEKNKGEKELHAEIMDFFENLLSYLEESKKDTEKIGENVNSKLESHLKDSLNYLQESKKESAGIVENTNWKLEESKDLQSKTIVLMRQILEHQKDQALFLKEEIGKLKDE